MTTLPEEAVKAAAKCYLERAVSINETASSLAHAMLTAALPHLPQGVGVKKLEWRDGYKDSQCTIIQADTLGGTYQVRQVDGLIWLDSIGKQTIYPTLEAAKAAAQADYSARILSALEPSTARELHGPFGHIVGRRDLREDEWSLENDPVNEDDAAKGFFSVPLYALTDPFKEIGIEGPANAGSPTARELALEPDWISIAKMAGKFGIRYQSNQGFVDFLKSIRSLSSPDHADAGKVEGDGWLPSEYEVYCDDEWVAASNDLREAMNYAANNAGDGFVELVEVRRRPLTSASSQEVAGS